MNLTEMFNDEASMDGYYTDKEDSTALKLSDVRKTKLTLAQINRLRIMNDIRRFEHEKDIDNVQAQYKPVQDNGNIM